jgi:hypothetical protein
MAGGFEIVVAINRSSRKVNIINIIDMTQVALLFEKHKHCLKLGYEKEIANSEGPVLKIYMDTERHHWDMYLYAACKNSLDYICIKIDQSYLLRYLKNEIVLQELIFSCPEYSFYFEWHTDKGQLIVEVPFSMVNNYPISLLAKRINEIPEGMLNHDAINSLITDINTWNEQDPQGEEQWFLNEDTKQLIVDAGLYLKN